MGKAQIAAGGGKVTVEGVGPKDLFAGKSLVVKQGSKTVDQVTGMFDGSAYLSLANFCRNDWVFYRQLNNAPEYMSCVTRNEYPSVVTFLKDCRILLFNNHAIPSSQFYFVVSSTNPNIPSNVAVGVFDMQAGQTITFDGYRCGSAVIFVLGA